MTMLAPVENWPVRQLGADDTSCLKPMRPVLAVIKIDKGKLQHVGWFGQTAAAGE
jgi:hypothetical protein